MQSPRTYTQDQHTTMLMAAPEAAATLAISERKLWSLTKSGEIPHLKIGRSVRYVRTDILNWIDANKKGVMVPSHSEASSPVLEA